MSFKVSTFNQESGWTLGTFLSNASTEAEAVADATKRYGIEGITGFRHVVEDVGETAEAVASVVQPVTETVSEAAPVVAEAVPSVAPEAVDVEKVAEALKGEFSPDVLSRIFARVNNALGG